jgi:hypothetical protein
MLLSHDLIQGPGAYLIGQGLIHDDPFFPKYFRNL